jgi:hypothetical protein
MMHNHLLLRTSRLVLAGVVLAVLVTSCGDDGSDPEDSGAPVTTTATVTTTTQDLCADRESLKDSIDALTEVDVRAEGTNGVETAVAAVQEDLTAVGESADAELQPEVDALQDAIDELGPAVENIGDGGAAQAATAIADVATAAGNLIESLQDAECP